MIPDSAHQTLSVLHYSTLSPNSNEVSFYIDQVVGESEKKLSQVFSAGTVVHSILHKTHLFCTLLYSTLSCICLFIANHISVSE